MRLRERNKQPVALYAFAGENEDAYVWGERTDIRASLFPLETALDAQVSGERRAERRLMLCEGDAPLELGMGVALHDGAPAYRIVKLARWSHWEATLERIREGRRGDAMQD